MEKYKVVIMGKKSLKNCCEMVIEGFITVNGGEETEDGFVELRNIIFNPLEFLGDLRYIAEDMNCYSKKLVNIFHAPYYIEPCLDSIEIVDKEKYFKLLDEIKKIICSDKKVSILDVYQMANFYNIPIRFEIDFEERTEDNGLKCFESSNDVFGTNDKIKYVQKDYIYSCRCNEIADIVIAVLNYLVLFDYHFYQCKHCKRYSAELRHQKDRRYCMRKNRLNISEYENMSCRDAIPKVLNLIYKKYERKERYLGREIIEANEAMRREKEHEKLKETYKQKKKIINENPSYENIIWLINYLDNIEADGRKKRK